MNKRGMNSIISNVLIIMIVVLIVSIIGLTVVKVTKSVNEPVVRQECKSLYPEDKKAYDDCVTKQLGTSYVKKKIDDSTNDAVTGGASTRDKQTTCTSDYETNYILPDLSDSEINALSSANSIKLNEFKNLRRIEKEYNDVKISGINVINPIIYLKKADLKNKLDYQTEVAKASSIFLANKLKELCVPQKVQESLDEINNKDVPWEANYNSVFFKDDKYKEVISSGLNVLKNKTETDSLSYLSNDETGYMAPNSETGNNGLNEYSAMSESNIPSYFDWRNVNGENYLTTIKNQGSCGSCWAFADVGALEGQANAYFNNPGINGDISEQDLVSCGMAGSCNGGWPELALNYIVSNNITSEDKFPYSASDLSCNYKLSDWRSSSWGLKSWFGIPLNITDIKNALMTYGPLITGMTVYHDFFSYSGGIYRHSTDKIDGYHAIVIVGYGEYDGATYWIVRNSWGTGWGESGYFRIFAGDSNIDSWFIYAINQSVPNPVQSPICKDKDKDGYCNWGLGPKPTSGCPVCNDLVKDCDDNNSTAYEKCGISDKKYGYLNISSLPKNAELFIRDIDNINLIYRGTTPSLIRLTPGERDIVVRAQDYFEVNLTVSIIENKITNEFVKMYPEPKILYPPSDILFFNGESIEINGTVPQIESPLVNYSIDYKLSKSTENWSKKGIDLVNGGRNTILNSTLAIWNLTYINASDYYDIRLSTYYADGFSMQVYQRNVYIEKNYKNGWPKKLNNPIYSVISEDFVGDGNKEILAVTSKGEVFLYYSNGTLVPNWPKQVKGSWPFYVTTGKKGSSLGKKIVIAGSFMITVLDVNGNKLIEIPITENHPAPPSIAELDQNGMEQIVVAYRPSYFTRYRQENMPGKLYVFESNGSLRKGWPFTNDQALGGFSNGAAIADVDDDGKEEIVIGGDNFGRFFMLRENGSMQQGWPVPVNFGSQTKMDYPTGGTSVIVDINNDGKKEIIAHTNGMNGADFNLNGLSIYSGNGTVLTHSSTQWNFLSAMAIGDLNVVGEKYIILSSYGGGCLRIINRNLASVGCKQITTSAAIYFYMPYSYSVIGDINGDENEEIIQSPTFDLTGAIYSWNGEASFYSKVQNGWPKKLGVENSFDAEAFIGGSYPIITSLDDPGRTNIVLGTLGGNIYIWEYNSTYNKNNQPWPQYQHDSQHTGCYDCKAPTYCRGNFTTYKSCSQFDFASCSSFNFHGGQCRYPIDSDSTGSCYNAIDCGSQTTKATCEKGCSWIPQGNPSNPDTKYICTKSFDCSGLKTRGTCAAGGVCVWGGPVCEGGQFYSEESCNIFNDNRSCSSMSGCTWQKSNFSSNIYSEPNINFKPATPLNFEGNEISKGEATLSWIDNSSNEDGFVIEMKDKSGEWVIKEYISSSYDQKIEIGRGVKHYISLDYCKPSYFNNYRIYAVANGINSSLSDEIRISCTTSFYETGYDFGGMFALNYSQNVLYKNPITNSQSCPSGYNTTKIFGVPNQEFDIYLCYKNHIPGTISEYDFGGMFSYNGTSGVYSNPITKGQNCSEGFIPTKIYGLVNVDYPMFYCYRNHVEGRVGPYDFGGMFGFNQTTGYYKNPITNSQSCPSGYNTTKIFGMTNVHWPFYFCWAENN